MAKDIAAFANSGGGVIVYGVKEVDDPASTAADHVVPVGDISEGTLLQIRQVAGNLIYPPVVDLSFERLAPPDASTEGVLVLHVTDSSDTPHLVHPSGRYSDYFIAPWRDGAHTSRMKERQLATMYRFREQNSRRRAQNLEDTWSDCVRAHVHIDTAWIVAVAVPDRPTRVDRKVEPSHMESVMDEALSLSPPRGVSPLRILQTSFTRRGLRRLYRMDKTSASNGVGRSADMRASLELHDDGAIGIAFTRAGVFPSELPVVTGMHVAIADIEQVAHDLLSTVIAQRRVRGVHVNYLVRVGIPSATQIFRRSDPSSPGLFLPFDETHRIPDYRPVDAVIIATLDMHSAVDGGLEVVRDVVNQAGAEPAFGAEYYGY